MDSRTSDSFHSTTQNVGGVLTHAESYCLDFYQREYRWNKEHDRLIEDLLQAFVPKYKGYHQPDDWSLYPEYNLDTIKIASEDGKRYIVDGQQRLTSLTLIILYLVDSLRGRVSDKEINSFLEMVYGEILGEKKYRLHIPERELLLDALVQSAHRRASEEQVNPANNSSVRRMQHNYLRTSEIFAQHDIFQDARARYAFLHWLQNKVFFTVTTTRSRKEAYHIFTTSNDRGLKIEQHEILKARILADLKNIEKEAECNRKWMRALQLNSEHPDDKISSEKSNRLLLDFLRARYYGKEQDDNRLDLDSITRWTEDNILKGVPEEAEKLINEISHFAMLYNHIALATEQYQEKYPHLFLYAACPSVKTEMFPLMAATTSSDTIEVALEKANLVAQYLEGYYMRLVVNQRSLVMGFKAHTFTMLPKIRAHNSSVVALARFLKKKTWELESDYSSPKTLPISPEQWLDPNKQSIRNLKLHQNNGKQINFFLSRLGAYLEKKVYPSKNEGDQFIRFTRLQNEHIVPQSWQDQYAQWGQSLGFSNPDDFKNKIQSLGNLVLLDERDNPAVSNKPYQEKLAVYQSSLQSNILTATLGPTLYGARMFPGFKDLKEDAELGTYLRPYQTFNKRSIMERQFLYEKVAAQLWGPCVFDEYLPEDERGPLQARPPQYLDIVAEMLSSGILNVGQVVAIEVTKGKWVEGEIHDNPGFYGDVKISCQIVGTIDTFSQVERALRGSGRKPDRRKWRVKPTSGVVTSPESWPTLGTIIANFEKSKPAPRIRQERNPALQPDKSSLAAINV